MRIWQKRIWLAKDSDNLKLKIGVDVMQGKRYFCFAFFTCLLVTLTFPTFAADETLFNTVNLQASAEREIPNDEMIVLLATEHEGSETASLASKINSDMQWALELIKQYPTIQSQTRSYQTYPTYRKQVIIGWRASQQVEIKSKDISALTELVGKLQEKLQVKQMSFNPSKETRINFENELRRSNASIFSAC
jgi:predicted secreted protein